MPFINASQSPTLPIYYYYLKKEYFIKTTSIRRFIAGVHVTPT